MPAVVSLLVVVTVSLLITRVAAVALQMTGLSRTAARFQATSAFTGVGFTTGEAESIVQHAVRRRIVLLLMVSGNIGLVSVLSTLMLSLWRPGDESGAWLRLVVLAAGVAFLVAIAFSRWVDRRVCRCIQWALGRWTTLESRDFAGLLHLADGFGVAECRVSEGDAGRRLSALVAAMPGFTVLGLQRAAGDYEGAPAADTPLAAGDVLIIYGPTQASPLR